MLAISGGARIFLCHGATDLRKGFEGLSALVESNLKRGSDQQRLFYFRQQNKRPDKDTLSGYRWAGYLVQAAGERVFS